VGLPARSLLTIYAQTKMCWIGHLRDKETAHPCPRCPVAALPIVFCVRRMLHHSHPPTIILSSQYLTHPQAHKKKHATRYICGVTASDFCLHPGPKTTRAGPTEVLRSLILYSRLSTVHYITRPRGEEFKTEVMSVIVPK